MHSIINDKSSTRKISSIRNRPPLSHSHQEKRSSASSTTSISPVEFKTPILHADTPKLIFGQGVSPMYRSQSPVTPQHEENVKFITEEWENVRNDLNNQDLQQHRKGCVQYVERNEYVNEGFRPFDLEEFWGKRMLKDVGMQNVDT